MTIASCTPQDQQVFDVYSTRSGFK